MSETITWQEHKIRQAQAKELALGLMARQVAGDKIDRTLWPVGWEPWTANGSANLAGLRASHPELSAERRDQGDPTVDFSGSDT